MAKVGISPAGKVVSQGAKTVPTGTAEVLASQVRCVSIVVKSLYANTADVYIGGSGVTTSDGYPIAPGESMSFDVASPSEVYCISGTASQVLRYLALGD